jgi:starch phosphorylase
MAAAYDTPVVGWNAGWANTLRLWAAHSVEGFDLDSFNRGDFVGAATREEVARTISRVLYPDDTTPTGKELRLKQEYFFTAASLADILRRFMDEHGDLRRLPQKVAIQLNDTHPAIAGPELVRLLHDEHRIPFDEAMEIARGTLSYTNHTLLPEALERWSEDLFGRSCRATWRSWTASTMPMPRPTRAHGQHPRARRGQDGRAELRHGAQGQRRLGAAHRADEDDRVSRISTGCIPTGSWPDQRRHAAPLASVLQPAPGADHHRPDRRGLGRRSGAALEAGGACGRRAFLAAYAEAKRANKADLAAWVAAEHGLTLDPDMMFDVQIKRLHEYKRQHLNILEAVALGRRSAPTRAGLDAAGQDLRREGRAGLSLRQGYHPPYQ